MKKLFFILVFACALVLPAFATDVTIASQQIPNSNFANIGADRAITVSVTNGLTTITSAGLFRAYIGLGGFTVTVASTRYTVSYVTDANTLTLTTAYGGSTNASASLTWHKYVEVRIYSSLSFRPLGQTYMVPVGAPDSGNFYKRFAASVINLSGVNTLFFPQFTIDATTDAPINNTARYTIGYYSPAGARLEYYSCGSVVQLAVPPTTPTNLADLCSYNSSVVIVEDRSSYTRTEIDRRLPSCTANQIIYAAATGNAYSCLTVGTNLSISSGTLNATGGAGSSPTATQTSANYTALTTDWLISVNAAAASRTVTATSAVATATVP